MVGPQKQPGPLVFTQDLIRLCIRKKKSPLHEAPEIWGLFVVATTLIILMNVLPFNESSLSSQLSVAGGPLHPSLASHNPHLEFVSE